MKKIFMILLVGVFIAGCSNDDTTNGAEEKDEQEKDVTDTNKQSKDKENKDGYSEESSGASELGIEEKDQLNLGIGDTGKFDTINGIYEITLEDAKIIKDEMDGEKSQLDDLILLDLTLKNTGKEVLPIDDSIGNLEITENLDKTGASDGAEYFNSVEEMTGELEPNEETKGQFITDVYKGEEYYLKLRSGYAESGKANEVIFTIKADEAQ